MIRIYCLSINSLFGKRHRDLSTLAKLRLHIGIMLRRGLDGSIV